MSKEISHAIKAGYAGRELQETSLIFYIPVLHLLPRTKMLTRSKSLH